MLSTENTWVLKSSLLKYSYISLLKLSYRMPAICSHGAHMGQVYLSGQHSEMTPPPYHKKKSFIECKHLCRNKDGREADRYLMSVWQEIKAG